MQRVEAAYGPNHSTETKTINHSKSTRDAVAIASCHTGSEPSGFDSDTDVDDSRDSPPIQASKKVRFASPTEMRRLSPEPESAMSPYYAELLSYFDPVANTPDDEPTFTGKMYVDLYTRDGRALYYSSCVQTRQRELLLYADPLPSLPRERTAAGMYGALSDLHNGFRIREHWRYTGFYTRQGERLLVRTFTPWPTSFVSETSGKTVPLLMYRPQHAPRGASSTDSGSEPDCDTHAFTLDGMRVDPQRGERRERVERLLSVGKLLALVPGTKTNKTARIDTDMLGDSDGSSTCAEDEDEDEDVELIDIDEDEEGRPDGETDKIDAVYDKVLAAWSSLNDSPGLGRAQPRRA